MRNPVKLVMLLGICLFAASICFSQSGEEYWNSRSHNGKDNSKKDEESELSDESEKNSDNENEYNDHLLAQYQKVKRVKNKWKVTFIGCVVQKDNKEYICGKIHGELEREW